MRLYTFLCGPILRRIEPKKICIWFATSIQPKDVEVFIYNLTRKNPLNSEYSFEETGWQVVGRVNTSTKYNVHQLGGKLFVILLEVTPEHGNFSEETIYGYDTFFEFNDSDKVILNEKDFGAKKGGAKKIFFIETLNQEHKYTYARLPYPVIVIPNQNKPNSRILYGSCRKTHGPGSDALNAASGLLEESWLAYERYWNKFDSWNQPSSKEPRIPDFSLFHLGDQIYADDLHEEVFKAMRELADSLMGYDETIPAYNNIEELTFQDLINFLDNYLKGIKGYNIEDLNLLTQVAYTHRNKRRNIILFLENYYSTYISNKKKRLDFDKLPDSFLRGKISLREFIDGLVKLTDINNTLIDLNEILPREYLLKSLKTIKTEVKNIGFKDRKSFVRNNSSISTVDAGHLLSFGEFAALYLLNWGGFEVFDKDSDTAQKLSHSHNVLFKTYYDDYKANLEGTIYGNQQIKRLFANVPSYMIFDDHDVTDDWNCDEVWRNRVEKSVMGKRMVSNALAAYWAFQGWGNNPDTFSDGKLINAITEYLQSPLGSQGRQEDSEKAKKYDKSLWEFADWAFIAPTNPIAVFLDNRTMRHGKEDMNYYPQLNNNRKYKAVRLMSPNAFEKIESLLKSSNYKKDTPIIFCAPTPIIGSELAHKLQILLVNGSGNKKFLAITKNNFKNPGRYEHDWEQWWSSPRGKYEFFNFIDGKIQPSHIFILSGEVHYGFHAVADLYSELTRRSYHIQQLTSSALKNNTRAQADEINKLALVAISLDTGEEKYRIIDETYPFPDSPPESPFHFKLIGKLKEYSHIIDKDSLLIPHNNIGFIEFLEKDRLYFLNLFLHSAYYGAPIVKSRSLNEPIYIKPVVIR